MVSTFDRVLRVRRKKEKKTAIPSLAVPVKFFELNCSPSAIPVNNRSMFPGFIADPKVKIVLKFEIRLSR